MSFDENFIEKVRSALDIVDLVQDSASLKGRGTKYMGICPFPDHPEKTPSFSVDRGRQLYHCFGCKKSGDIFSYVSDYYGLSFPEAVKWLAERAGIEVPSTPAQSAAQKKSSAYYKVNQKALEFFSQQFRNLEEAHPVKKYCLDRGLDPEMQTLFKIGWASESWSDFAGSLDKTEIKAAEELGLIKARSKKDGHYDFFRSRLIFPILSLTGKVYGFGGRTLDEKENPPKYLNSSESTVFKKKSTFYGLNLALASSRAHKCMIIVEGYMDVIALHKAGYKNTVAPLGTALTVDHVKAIKKYGVRPILIMDSDKSGQQAVVRSLPLFLAEDVAAYVVKLEDAKDPDECLAKHGVDHFADCLEKAQELFLFTLEKTIKETPDGITKAQSVLESMRPYLQSLKGPSQILYIQACARYLNQTPAWVSKVLFKGKGKAPTIREIPNETAEAELPEVSASQVERHKVSYLTAIEQNLIWLSLMNESCLSSLLKVQDEVSVFFSKDMLAISKGLLDRYQAHPERYNDLTSWLMSHFEGFNFSVYQNPPLSEMDGASQDEFWQENLRQLTQISSLSQQIQDLRQRVKMSQSTPEQKEELTMEILELERRKRRLSSGQTP